MYHLTIKISLILLLLVGCSPEKIKIEDDIATLTEVKGPDEYALESERLEKSQLFEEKLTSTVDNQKQEVETTLIEETNKFKSNEEEKLRKAEIEQRLANEQALLDDAKLRELPLEL